MSLPLKFVMLAVISAKKEMFNCHGLSHIIFGVRMFRVKAFEVLYLVNNSEFKKKTVMNLYLIRKKFLPLKFVRQVLDAVWVKM